MKHYILSAFTLLLASVGTIQAQSKFTPEDDLYFQPKQENTIVKNQRTQSSLPFASDEVSGDGIQMSTDAYNRRFVSDQYEEDVTDESGYYLNEFNGSQADYEYAERIRRFHNPKFSIHISSPAYHDVFFLSSMDWNVYIDDTYAYVTPTWSNRLYWNFNYGPSFSWGWGNSWNRPWHRPWNYGPGWGGYYGWNRPGHWGPVGGYGYGFGYGNYWGGYWGGHYGWNRPPHRPPHHGNHKPSRPHNPYLGHGTTPRQPNVRPSGSHYSSSHGRPGSTVRPGQTTRPGSGHRPPNAGSLTRPSTRPSGTTVRPGVTTRPGSTSRPSTVTRPSSSSVTRPSGSTTSRPSTVKPSTNRNSRETISRPSSTRPSSSGTNASSSYRSSTSRGSSSYGTSRSSSFGSSSRGGSYGGSTRSSGGSSSRGGRR